MTTLDQTITELASVPGGNHRVLSCFIDLSTPGDIWMQLQGRVEELLKTTQGDERAALIYALDDIRDRLDGCFTRKGGMAFFCRAGEKPFFKMVTSGVPFETSLHFEDYPELFPLIANRDSYAHFVLHIATATEARTLNLVAGTVVSEEISNRHLPGEQSGHEWSRKHLKRARTHRQFRFFRGQIRGLTRKLAGEGSGPLILAAPREVGSVLEQLLPNRVKRKLFANLEIDPSAGIAQIINEAISTYAAAESVTSHHRVAELEKMLINGGPAVGGYLDSYDAISQGSAEFLLIDHGQAHTASCESLIRLALEQGIEIETVRRSLALQQIGGFGCLLGGTPSADLTVQAFSKAA